MVSEKNSIQINKRLFYAISVIVLLVFIAVILGLSIGLTRDKKCNNSESSSQITTTKPLINKEYRLPKTLKANFYDINIITNFDSLTEPSTFNGSIVIKFKCVEKTNKIVLHKTDIYIKEDSVKITDGLNNNINYLSATYENETQLYTISLSQGLEKDKDYFLTVDYVGQLAYNLGFYKSSYIDSQGKKK